MNAIILYGGRYGASQTYAQALEARTGPPPWPTKRSRTLAPLTPSSTSAASMPVRPQGWPKPSATSPQTIPSAYWWLRWACPTPPWRTTSCASGSPWPRNSPRHLRAHHPCPPPRGHRLQRSHHPPPADDERAVHPPAPPAGGGPVPRHPGPAGQLRQSGGFHRPGHPGPHPNLVGKGLKIPFIIAPNRTG